MGGEIIAEKFALIKTKGSNGVAFTHVVEDTLLGERAVVKVSGKFGLLALEYLKTANLARESGVKGVLMPFEEGILEEEAGIYLAFPEVGEPSLESYLRIWAPLTCREAVKITIKLLSIVEALHDAGFVHLFIGTRNVFYHARGEVTLKDPALKAEFFHPLLESIDAPDFSYFSPGVMDGEEPGPEADLYALGRLAERLLEGCVDAASSPEAEVLAWAGERLRGAAGSGRQSPGGIRREIEGMLMRPRGTGEAAPVSCAARRHGGADCKSGTAAPAGRISGRRGRLGIGKKSLGTISVFVSVLLLLASLAFLAGPVRPNRLPAGAGVAGGTGAGGSGEGPAALKEAVGGGPESEATTASMEVESLPEASGETVSSASGVQVDAPGEAAGGGYGDGFPRQPFGENGQEAAPGGQSPSDPVALFTISPESGQSPLQVRLDASTSFDPDGSIVSYSWSFGGSGKSACYVFESSVIPAIVPVTLTVTDDGGNSASVTRYLTLY